jgi:hypothetical protein
MNNKEHWLTFIDTKRRHNLLLTLEELSTLTNKKVPDFVVIGAMSLLIQGFIGGYKVLWDVDLLFKNGDCIMDFRKKKKSKDLRIVELDDRIVENRDIGSLHAVWSFNKTWFNVDYIIKGDLFHFYNPLKRGEQPYTEIIRYNNKDHHISLFLADPIDVFVEKIVSPRMEKELKLMDDFGVDIKHCLYMIQKFGEENWFWKKTKDSATEIDEKEELKKRLINLIAIKDKLGYADTKLPDNIQDRINKL